MSELEALSAFLEVIPDAVFVVAEDGVIVAVNRQAELLTGRPREELLGASIESLVPERLAAAHVSHRGGYFAAAHPRPMGTGLDTRVLRRDGAEVPVDIALSPLELESRRLAVASVRDTTEQRRAADQIQAALSVTQAMLEGRSTGDVLEIVTSRARDLARAGRAQVLAHAPAVGLDPERSSISVPLRQEGREFGTLVVTQPAHRPSFDESDVAPLDFLATQASLALEHARLQDEIQRLALVDERERIGRELHDGAIQAIFAIGMSIEGLAARTTDADVAERLRGTVAQLDGVIRDLRSYIYGLRPGLVARQQLEQALRQLVGDFAGRSGVTAVAEIEPDAARALAGKAADVVLLATEALSNVGRHAQALTCRLSLHRDGATAILQIEDDGIGFDTAAESRGQGLRNLRERAERLGGTAEVESTAGDGTAVRFTLPLES